MTRETDVVLHFTRAYIQCPLSLKNVSRQIFWMPIINPIMLRDLISGNLYPQPYVNELFVLQRDNVSLKVSSPSHGKLSGSGLLHISNCRIVFHCLSAKSRTDFLSYELQLSEICKEKFEQPIFGANYLCGESAAGRLGEQGDAWRLTFCSGGCGTLLPVLADLLQRARLLSNQNSQSSSNRPVVVQSIPQYVGYIDPNDPSVVILQQPVLNHAAPRGLE